MKRLYEAFTSKIINFLYEHDKPLMDRLFKATLKHGYSFDGLVDSDIRILKPGQAFKYAGDEGDKYLKIWMSRKNRIAFCTWANTMIDDNFNWNRKAKGSAKRVNDNIIGDPFYFYAYLRNENAINEYDMSVCYMIPFAKLKKIK